MKIKPPSIQTFPLKSSQKTWTYLPSFYVQTSTTVYNININRWQM